MSDDEEYKYTDIQLDLYMTTCLDLVLQAGEIIKKGMRQDHRSKFNLKDEDCKEGNASSVLTETDTAVEKHLIDGLSASFPDHCFIGEEDISASASGMVETYSNKPTWIIDPIDGTMNFVHRNPLVCTSVGLAINRRLVLGIVNSPMTNHTYSAIKGKGAFLNGDKLRTSGAKTLKEAMVLMELPVGANEAKRTAATENVVNLMTKVHSIRCPGPAALDIAWVGAGSADAFFHFGIHCWDMAAGALIITEAGGSVLSADGKEFDLMGRGIIAGATKELAKELAGVVNIYRTADRDFKDHCPM